MSIQLNGELNNMEGIDEKYYDDLKQLCKNKANHEFNKLNFNDVIEKYLKNIILRWSIEDTSNLSFLTADGKCNDDDIFNIIDFVYLIKYLEDSGYVYIQKHIKQIDKKKYIFLYDGKINRIEQFNSDSRLFYLHNGEIGIPIFSLPGQKLNTDVGNLLNKYEGALIYPSSLLVDLVKHQFKTVEQRRFEIQIRESERQYNNTICWTRASFIVALIAALAAIFIPCCISTKIDKSQYEDIKQVLNGIHSSLQDTTHTITINKK